MPEYIEIPKPLADKLDKLEEDAKIIENLVHEVSINIDYTAISSAIDDVRDEILEFLDTDQRDGPFTIYSVGEPYGEEKESESDSLTEAIHDAREYRMAYHNMTRTVILRDRRGNYIPF